MIIKINYKTSYKYTSHVPRLVQSLNIYPTECKNQKVIDCDIKASQGKLEESPVDALGHKTFNIYIKNLNETQTITMKSTVETKDYSGVMKGLNESVHPSCFLRQSNLTKPNMKIINLVKNTNKKDSVEFCHGLNNAAADSIKYLSGSTNIFTSAINAIEQGSGVCQDFSHILISLARSHNFPARYVNGFLLDDSEIAENDTHAWVEIYINNLGWVGFDPCHKRCINDTYIRVGCGYDFSYTPMIKGVKSNYNGEEYMSKELVVQAQSSQ